MPSVASGTRYRAVCEMRHEARLSVWSGRSPGSRCRTRPGIGQNFRLRSGTTRACGALHPRDTPRSASRGGWRQYGD